MWQVEQSEFCRGVLARHWPGAERFSDVRAVGAHNLEPVSLLCGGFPCQDISSAGKGAGLSGKRSGLWFEFARIVEELRPRWVVVENVASGAKRWVDQVRSHLGGLGYETLPIPISAENVGAPHLRRRIFIVAYSEREPVRIEQGRSKGPDEERAPEFGHASETRATSHTNSNSKPTIPQHDEMAGLQSLASDTPAWSTPPQFRGVDDGVPNRLERLKALGNAVVPQCSEVIGHIIQELEGET